MRRGKSNIPIDRQKFETALKNAGISKYKLAKMMPMSLRNVQRCINEGQGFSYFALLRACELLNVSPDEVAEMHRKGGAK